MTERRGETRLRIRTVALELFAEQGYEKTSLREIAERLGFTKAALYYHFKSKEDIVVSLFDDFGAEIDALIEWGRALPPGPDARRALLERYIAIMQGTGRALTRFLQENQPAFRALRPGAVMKQRFRTLLDLMTDPGAGVADRLRVRVAVFAVNWGELLTDDLVPDDGDRLAALSQVAMDLVLGPGKAAGAAGHRES